MIVFDLDGTLRNTSCSDGKVPADITVAANWVDWQYHVNEHGKPIGPMVELYKYLHSSQPVVIVTSSQFGTLTWLDKHRIPYPDSIVERCINDDRSPFDYKKEFIDNHPEISLWVDDSKQVCDYVESRHKPVVRVNPKFYEV